MNNQIPTPVVKTGDTYLVHSIFQTIQGEGPFNGTPAIFIRLAGCNLQCPMCDTEYTEGSLPYTATAILSTLMVMVGPNPSFFPLIVITGGEPFRQPIGHLINILLSEGYRVQIETNGSIYQSLDSTMFMFRMRNLTIVCSPKTARVDDKLLLLISAFKYVVTAGEIDPVDGLPTHVLGMKGKRTYRPSSNFPRDRIYVQPADLGDPDLNKANMNAAIRSCSEHGYRLCLQMHKIAGLA